MKISVIMPVYNAALYIEDTLRSLLAQTYKDFECICIDDGSKDDSAIILDKWASKYSNLTVQHIPNGGVSAARNMGVMMAMGEWVVFADADDWISPDYLKSIDHVVTNSDVDMFQFKPSHLDAKGERSLMFPLLKNAESFTGDILRELSQTGKIGAVTSCVWDKAFKREFLVDNKIGFDEKLQNGEDVLFDVMALARARKFEIRPEIQGYTYVARSNSLFGKWSEKRCAGEIHFVQAEIDLAMKLKTRGINEVAQRAAFTLLMLCADPNERPYDVFRNLLKSKDGDKILSYLIKFGTTKRKVFASFIYYLPRTLRRVALETFYRMHLI